MNNIEASLDFLGLKMIVTYQAKSKPELDHL